MSLSIPAQFFPLEISAIKDRPELRISGTANDAVLLDHMIGAIQAYQDFTANVLCRSTWILYLDSLDDEIETPAPLHDVLSFEYLDSAGVLQTFDAANYVVDGHSDLTGVIDLAAGASWPGTADQRNAVVITAEIGYGSPGEIPQLIKDGLIAKIEELFYGRSMRDVYERNWANYRRHPV